MSTLEYYKMIKNSVKLVEVELLSMNCYKRDTGKKEDKGGEVHILLQRDVNLISSDQVEIILKSRIGIEDGPFEFNIVYKGLCVSSMELSNHQLEQYAYDQIVPLLLPYLRECVASTMARMRLPIFTLPTMDVLDSIEANLGQEEELE